jgi:hypothetical protein
MTNISDTAAELFTDLKSRQFGDAVVGVCFRLADPAKNIGAAYLVTVTRDLTPSERAQVPPRRPDGFPVVVERGDYSAAISRAANALPYKRNWRGPSRNNVNSTAPSISLLERW